jgi:predicted MPP superfamily phosphohydrolase
VSVKSVKQRGRWRRFVLAVPALPHDAPVIAFTRNPHVFPLVPARVKLTVAGHTHGGHVRVPFVGRPVIPSR